MHQTNKALTPMIAKSEFSKVELAILNKKVFTRTAASRILSEILGITITAYQARKIKLVDYEYVIWVHFPGFKPRFISRMDFVIDFIEFRANSADSGQITTSVDEKLPLAAVAVSQKPNGETTEYLINMTSKGVRCQCEDYQYQAHDNVFLTAFNKYIDWSPCCKHSIAFLHQHGLNSHQDWIKRQTYSNPWNVLNRLSPQLSKIAA